MEKEEDGGGGEGSQKEEDVEARRVVEPVPPRRRRTRPQLDAEDAAGDEWLRRVAEADVREQRAKKKAADDARAAAATSRSIDKAAIDEELRKMGLI